MRSLLRSLIAMSLPASLVLLQPCHDDRSGFTDEEPNGPDPTGQLTAGRLTLEAVEVPDRDGPSAAVEP